jgi:dehydrogenase/reductase SDR family protein 12
MLQVDCSHRSYVVTGANSGIGRAVALDLAKRGATVHMFERANDERAAELTP